MTRYETTKTGLLALLFAALLTVAASALAADHQGGELRIGFTGTLGLDDFDPSVTTARNARIWYSNIYDPLIWQLEPGNFQPGLAVAWEHDDDLTFFRLTLREGVELHDGTPFNADLLVHAVERILDPETDSQKRDTVRDAVRFEAVEDFVFEIEFSAPQPRFMDRLSEYDLSPNSPSAIEALGPDYTINPVSTGPYMVEGWRDERTFVMVRNESWVKPDWMGEEFGQFLDRVIVNFIPERETAAVALERGEVDMVFDPPNFQMSTYVQRDDFATHIIGVGGVPMSLHLNTTRWPTNDLYLRRAIQHVINQEELAQLLFFGVLPPGQGVLSHQDWAFLEGYAERYPYDPELAHEIMAEGGWERDPETGIYHKDGEPATARMVVVDRPWLEIVQQSLQDLGIDLVLEVMGFDARSERHQANEYEINEIGVSGEDPDRPMRTVFHSHHANNNPMFNRSRIANPELDELIERGAAAGDFETRLALYHEAQRIIWDEAVFVPLHEDVYLWAHTTRLSEPVFSNWQMPLFATMYWHAD